MMTVTTQRRSCVLLTALLLLVLPVGCGGGGSGSDAVVIPVVVTGFSEATFDSQQPTAFTVTGSGFGESGSVQVKLVATAGTPFARGTAATLIINATVASDTELQGTTIPAGVQINDVQATICVLLPDGREGESDNPLTTVVAAKPAAYDLVASLSGGIEVVGHVIVDITHPGYAPGGTVEFSNTGVMSYRFRASAGATHEVIDSEIPGTGNPQTLRLTFSTPDFPAVQAWDVSCSNSGSGSPLYQFITVQSPSNTGFEQWAGDALGGTAFPSNGVWTPRPRFLTYDFDAALSSGISVVGHVIVDTCAPGYRPGGRVEFVSGGVASYRFRGSSGATAEVIDSTQAGTSPPQTLRIDFDPVLFPAVGAWDVSCSNSGSGNPLYQFITVQSPSNTGFEQWAGDALSGTAFPSGGTWQPRPRFIEYDLTASLSNSIALTGTVRIDTWRPGYVPGGTVEFNSGSVTQYQFSATNTSITEDIDSTQPGTAPPQTLRLTFSGDFFPAVSAWDVSCSNSGSGNPLYQCITVQSPSNTGFEQWAGNNLSGSSFPSSGAWVLAP